MPEVLRDLVMTVFTSLPFQSTSHAASSGSGNTGRLYVFEFDAVIFCWPIHRPPGESVITASALGYMPGDLNIRVVLTVRCGTAPATPATTAAARPAAAFGRPTLLSQHSRRRTEVQRETGRQKFSSFDFHGITSQRC